jgi:amino acid permease
MPEEIITPENNIVPPKESTTKPKNSQVNLTETIVKKYSIWSYAYFFLICVLSLFLVERKNYLTEIFPILVYIGFIVLFINHLCWAKTLNFCRFKKIATISLICYFIFCVVVVIFKIDFYREISIYFSGMLFALLLFIFTKKTKND